MPVMDNTVSLSKRAQKIKDSITMAITAKANQLKKEGKNILSFSAGEPDFDTPQNIKDAGIASINEGKTKYTPAPGIPELKAAVCQKLKADNDLDYTPDNIVISCGAKHSIYNAFLAVLDDGDEVIVPSPYWVSYPDQTELVGAVPKIIHTTDQAGFKITPEQLDAAITDKTKLVILNSPSNPTGAIYQRHELEALGDVILKHNLLVLSDEIYEKLIYDGEEHVSIAQISPELKERTILINGVSKAYSMTGWRIGYAAVAAPIAKAMGKLQSQTTSNPTAASQWASLEAVGGNQDAVEDMRIEFEKRRVVMANGLNSIEGITCLMPKGAFYAFPNVSALYGKSSKTGKIENAVDFCAHLLEEQLVACVPGSGFGAPDHIRLSYATSEADIKEGITRLNDFVKSLK